MVVIATALTATTYYFFSETEGKVVQAGHQRVLPENLHPS